MSEPLDAETLAEWRRLAELVLTDVSPTISGYMYAERTVRLIAECERLTAALETAQADNLTIASTLARVTVERVDLAKLASTTPQFDNPLDRDRAEDLRDRVLRDWNAARTHADAWLSQQSAEGGR
jgi:hypothetical protein